MTSSARVADPAEAIESAVAAWTADRPRPDHWIETAGMLRGRAALEQALRDGAASVLVTGPSGHGKTTLLRSFWHEPPRGFATVFVPAMNDAEPGQIAVRILATTRNGAPVHDAAGALSRMLRAQSLRGARPVLLVDDLHAMPREALAELLALAAGSRVGVGVVAAGSAGGALVARASLLPHPVREIAIDEPWTRGEAERLVAQIGASLPPGAAGRVAAIDVGLAMRTSFGNPRLLRAAIAEQLSSSNPPGNEAAIPPPVLRTPAPRSVASSEPDPRAPPRPQAERTPSLAAMLAASSAPPAPRLPAAPATLPAAPPTPAPPAAAPRTPRAAAERAPRAARARAQRRHGPWRRSLAIAVAACIAFYVLVERGEPIAVRTADAARGWISNATRTWAADASGWFADTEGRIAARMPEFSPAHTADTATAYVAERAHRVGDWMSDWKAPELPVARIAEQAEQARAWASDRLRPIAEWSWRAESPEPDAERVAANAPSTPPVAAAPPATIRVSVNSDPWSDVQVDGVDAGSTPLTIELVPGAHRFRAKMASGRIVEKQVEVTPDHNRIALR
jgi:AAA domain/PEGA domain